MPIQGTLLLAAHDAGGAESIAAWVRRHAALPFAVIAEGPARRVFENARMPGARMLNRGEGLRCLRETGTLLAGSSWG